MPPAAAAPTTTTTRQPMASFFMNASAWERHGYNPSHRTVAQDPAAVSALSCRPPVLDDGPGRRRLVSRLLRLPAVSRARFDTIARVPATKGAGNFRWVICALLFLAATINYVDR